MIRPTNTRVTRRPRPYGAVAQVALAFRPRNWLAILIGAPVGGIVPLASYTLAHREVDPGRPVYTQLAAWLVLGGLVFSSRSVAAWGRQAFGDRAKAWGLVVLLEGTLIASRTGWLSVVAMGVLVGINVAVAVIGLSPRVRA